MANEQAPSFPDQIKEEDDQLEDVKKLEDEVSAEESSQPAGAKKGGRKNNNNKKRGRKSEHQRRGKQWGNKKWGGKNNAPYHRRPHNQGPKGSPRDLRDHLNKRRGRDAPNTTSSAPANTISLLEALRVPTGFSLVLQDNRAN